MSNDPDDQPGQEQSSGQPESGRATGGQPASGQPQGQQGGEPRSSYQGQPQGGYQTGPGVGDILNIPETKNELKIGVVLNALLSIGFAIGALGASTLPFGGQFGATTIALTGPVAIAPLVGVLLGIRQADVLEDQPGNILMGNAGVTTFVGTFVMMLIAFILGWFIAGGSGIGQVIVDYIIVFLITAIGAAIVAVGTVWTVQNIVPGPARARSGSQGQPR